MKTIQYLVLHCTATAEGREVYGKEIREWHLSPAPKGRGWKQVGYTDLFHLNGGVERLVDNNEDAVVDSWEITNGAVGINGIARHVVYSGGLATDGKTAKDTRTFTQKEAMKKYVLDFVRRFPGVKVAGHNQFATKDCPSFNVPAWCRSIGVPENNIYKK
jgi:hypothetical protein